MSNRSARPKKKNRDALWNVLTGVMLLCSMCSCIYFYTLSSNPYSELNFFPPDTPTITPIPPTITPIAFPPTWTPTITLQPSPSNTRRPTFTLEPSNTPFTLATVTSSYTATITPKPTGAPYAATITYFDVTNYPFNKPRQLDCSAFLIAGRVFDEKNEPVEGAIIKMGGALPGKSFLDALPTLSGLRKDFYGASGFELDLGMKPVASTQTLWVQLFDQANALSTRIDITTHTDCKKNLIFVTFKKK